MSKLPLVMATGALAAALACGADTASPELQAPQTARVERVNRIEPPHVERVAIMPESPSDRMIRRHLNLAIERDPGLKDRGISFIVSNGDVSVTGLVRNENERKRINGLAMALPEVKSVANGLRVSP